jgi:hypothetical protein
MSIPKPKSAQKRQSVCGVLAFVALFAKPFSFKSRQARGRFLLSELFLCKQHKQKSPITLATRFLMVSVCYRVAGSVNDFSERFFFFFFLFFFFLVFSYLFILQQKTETQRMAMRKTSCPFAPTTPRKHLWAEVWSPVLPRHQLLFASCTTGM